MPASARAFNQKWTRKGVEMCPFPREDGNIQGSVLGRSSRTLRAADDSQTVRGPVLLSERQSLPSRYSDH